MARWGKCGGCGGEVWFDAYVTAAGVVLKTLEIAFCRRCGEDGNGEDGSGEIKLGHTIIAVPPPR